MLQSLLQPRINQRPNMIAAMPSVTLRYERRRMESRTVRRASTVGGRDEEVPSHYYRNEIYICGKVAALHAVVGSLLLGIVVLVVGLVQLSPGAEAAQHRYYLLGAGASLVATGVLGTLLRCLCLHWYNRRFEEYEDDSEPTAHKNGVSVVESGHGNDGHKTTHDRHEIAINKPKLKTQASVGRDHDQVKQPSAASDT